MDKTIINLIMRFRKTTLFMILLITAVFGFGLSKMTFYTQFIDLFPKKHPYVKIHKEFKEYFGGANVATLVLEVKEGDIFNKKTLEKIFRIQDDVSTMPGVNPYQVYSLASKRVLKADIIPGGYGLRPVMKTIPENEKEMAALKARVFVSEAFGTWVSEDLKALRLRANFIEDKIDYLNLINEFIEIRDREQDENHVIYLAGEPILWGWVYHFMPKITVLFIVSFAILVALLFFFLGRQPIWWLPLVSAALSAIWGLGMSGYLGYQLDPLIIVIPFLLTARAMSHGVQWLFRFGDEFQAAEDVKEAAHTTGIRLFRPCVIGVVTDACGVLIVAMIPIPILQHLAILGFFWGMSILFTVSLFNPVFVSFLSIKPDRYREAIHRPFFNTMMIELAKFSITKKGKVILIFMGVIALTAGVIGFTHVPIGDANPGSPILRPDSNYNQSVAEINKRFVGLEEMYILYRKNPNNSGFIINRDAQTALNNLKSFLLSKGNVVETESIVDFFSGYNMLMHGGDPKYHRSPGNDQLIFGIFMAVMNSNMGYGDTFKYFHPDWSAGNLRLYLRDHKGSTLKSVIANAKEWIANPENIVIATTYKGDRVQSFNFEPAGGLGGILTAAIEMIEIANHYLVGGILLFTFLCCAVVYRSLFAGFIFILSLVLANFTSFAYMAWKGIGLNINTLPVVSLGVGLGVDYGLYKVSRIKELIVAGASWEEGIIDGVSSTGQAVFYQAVMMSASVFFWWFSPLRFQAEMGFLLAILMMVNMLVGILLLPALIHIIKPKFISRDVVGEIPV